MTTKTDNLTDKSGTRADRARRRRFWILLGTVIAIGVALDAMLLPVIGKAPLGASPLPAAVAVGAAITLLALLYGGVWMYLRVADEVERQDNLIGFAAGYLFNIGAFVLWYLLALGGLTGRPEAFPLFVSTAGAGLLGYGFMKARRVR